MGSGVLGTLASSVSSRQKPFLEDVQGVIALTTRLSPEL